MGILPQFPIFKPVTLDMEDELGKFCHGLKFGISEFSFTNIFIDSVKYAYQISRISKDSLVIVGVNPSRIFANYDLTGEFFSILGELPEQEVLLQLFFQFKYWKNMSQEIFSNYGTKLSQQGLLILEDRDNFDYLYLRSELAMLQGKAFHKKKNLVNAFTSHYETQVKPLDVYSLQDAYSVLESWKLSRNQDNLADYFQCKKALDLFDKLPLSGIVVYAGGVPVGFSLGEYICNEQMFVVMFEKGINSYKGVYQFVNQAQALALLPSTEYINREQDLGDVGLRQAKMTYRPCGFTKKYLALPLSMCSQKAINQEGSPCVLLAQETVTI